MAVTASVSPSPTDGSMQSTTTRTAVIMQPTYLPWLGYFNMIDLADRFVFLDSVQFAHRSWQQRNRVKGANGEIMLTVPVLSKGRRDQRICETEIDPGSHFAQRHLRTFMHFYRRARHFDAYIDELRKIYTSHEAGRLGDFTMTLIRWFCCQLGIRTELLQSSSMACDGGKVERLVNICESLRANEYLAADGSRAYIDGHNPFGPRGIALKYHVFNHPRYTQLHGDFLPGMSIVDLLFNEGPASLSIIRSGRPSDDTRTP